MFMRDFALMRGTGTGTEPGTGSHDKVPEWCFFFFFFFFFFLQTSQYNFMTKMQSVLLHCYYKSNQRAINRADVIRQYVYVQLKKKEKKKKVLMSRVMRPN
ncbi:hypothetical protein PDJAM_G00041460 [Pangasius djambal]|uniref:Uncharacterized protein n=1 Tax=Pangasius djambal TaxID=1691987 RepID=A0ACC5YU17_9TELE|nr:hypothetical protein [Pangasius djambal]